MTTRSVKRSMLLLLDGKKHELAARPEARMSVYGDCAVGRMPMVLILNT